MLKRFLHAFKYLGVMSLAAFLVATTAQAVIQQNLPQASPGEVSAGDISLTQNALITGNSSGKGTEISAGSDGQPLVVGADGVPVFGDRIGTSTDAIAEIYVDYANITTLDAGVLTLSAAVDTPLKIESADGTATSTISTANTGTLTLGTDGSSNALTVLTGGNFGIGTTTPGYLLDVDGVLRVGQSGFANTFFVNSANGRVGIGTSTPAFNLDVFGDLRIAQDFQIDGTGTSTMAGNLDVAGDIEARDLYLSASSLYLGDTALTNNGGTLEFGGSAIGGGGGSFGGTGLDGSLNVTAATTTIDLGGAAVVIKNYTSINIDSGAGVNFSNPHANGTMIVLRSQGDATIAGMIDASGMGAEGGATTSPGSSSEAGTNGAFFLDTDNHYGAGGGQALFSSGTVNGGSGGSVHGNKFYYITANEDIGFRRFTQLTTGSGGGGGGGQVNGEGDGGSGGRGGAALIIESAGSLDFSGAVSVSGSDGTNGETGEGGRPGSGGGGGGSAGMALIIYSELTANTGTVIAAGGDGGDGGSSTSQSSTTSGAGGGGGGSYAGSGGAGANGVQSGTGSNGSSGALGAGGGGASGGENEFAAGGTGGSGGASNPDHYLITENLWW